MGVDTARVVHNEVLEDSHRDLICVFCSDLIDPHDALQAPCGHAFCSECILHSLTAGHEDCPLDKRSFKREDLRNLKEANPLVYRLLGRTEVRCENFKSGCPWRGDLFDAPVHLRQCQTKERHCECCLMNKQELKAAKELLVGYERLVSENKRDMRALRDQVLQLEAQLRAIKAQQHPNAPGAPSAASVRPANSPTGREAEPSGPSWTTALPSAPPLDQTTSFDLDLAAAPSAGQSTSSPIRYPSPPGGRPPASVEPAVPSARSINARASSGEDQLAVVGAAAELLKSGLSMGRNGEAFRSPSGLRAHSAEAAAQQDAQGQQRTGSQPGAHGSEARPGGHSQPLPRSGTAGHPTRIPRQPWQGGILSVTLHGHTAQITAMATSPEGKVLFSGSLDGCLRVWHLGKCIFSQQEFHVGCILGLAYAADSDTLYSCGEDKAVKAWPSVVRSIVGGGELPQTPLTVEDAAMMGPIPMRLCCAGRGRLVVAYSDGRVTGRENLRMALVIREKGPCSTPLDLVANDAGTVFFSGSPDHSIWVHNWGTDTRQLRGHEAEAVSLAAGPGNSLVSLSKDGVVCEWRDGKMSASYSGWRALGKLAMGIDGTVYCGRERERVVQCRRGGNCVYTLMEENVCKDEAVVVAIGSDGILYSGERAGAIRLWRCPG